MSSQRFSILHIKEFKSRALHYACSRSEQVFFLENNDIPYKYGAFPQALAFGAKRIFVQENGQTFEKLKSFYALSEQNIYGFFSYDLKNEIENLRSEHTDHIQFPECCFIEPECEILFNQDAIEIRSTNQSPLQIFNEIQDIKPYAPLSIPKSALKIESRFTKEEYIVTVNQIKEQIRAGNIYEMNFCVEFFAENIQIDPLNAFFQLNIISPMPFASFIKWQDKYAICASPERFLKKENDLLISQPIKGTISRGQTKEEDAILKDLLKNSEKERAENIMIVDIVRNDLSRTALDGSVKAEEICEIYSYQQVHQMVSTVTSRLSSQKHFTEAIQKAFPMGSMTGAPKIKAMEIIETLERTKRGIFSGSIGYITTKGDFDFNVVIRSILYNDSSKYLSFQAGSAITSDADAEKEYDECLIKTKAIRTLLDLH